MNIVKIRNSNLTILTDQIIRWDDLGNVVIVVAYTHDVRIFKAEDVHSIYPISGNSSAERGKAIAEYILKHGQ